MTYWISQTIALFPPMKTILLSLRLTVNYPFASYTSSKSNKEYIYNENIPHATCLCEIWENAVYFLKGLNKWLPNGSQMPINPHDIIERFPCDSSSDDCMYSNCDECGLQQGDEIIGEG